jgi:hypothetical protein
MMEDFFSYLFNHQYYSEIDPLPQIPYLLILIGFVTMLMGMWAFTILMKRTFNPSGLKQAKSDMKYLTAHMALNFSYIGLAAFLQVFELPFPGLLAMIIILPIAGIIDYIKKLKKQEEMNQIKKEKYYEDI